jgi:hypothetical protein
MLPTVKQLLHTQHCNILSFLVHFFNSPG